MASEGSPIRPRPAAQVARRPLSFPTTLGAVMTIGGALFVLIGCLTLTLPDDPVTVFGFGAGRTLPSIAGGLLFAIALIGRFSPSRFLRAAIAMGAVGIAVLAVIDTRRLGEIPRGAGMGITLVGAIVSFAGTFLREER